MALLRGMVQLQNDESSRLNSETPQLEIVAAHIDHQIREDSKADAEWVHSLAAELGLRCRIEIANVLARVAETQESLEEAARTARYEALVRLALEENCGAIATAHTADDQAETVLHHLVRGTSITGLRGMRWTRPSIDQNGTSAVQLIRPMLEIRRSDVEAWLQEIGQCFRTDTTNSDESLTRNRIRHQLLPMLERDFNPQVRKALGTLAGHAAEISDLLRSLANQLANTSLVQLSDDSIRIDCPALAEQPPVLIRETLLAIWQRANWPLKRMGNREWQAMAELVSRNSGAISLPEQISVRRRGQLLVLSREGRETEDAPR